MPSPSDFFYAGVNVGISSEFVRVTNTAPQYPLVPGDWWIAVVNNEVTPVNYAVRVTEDTNVPPNVVSLTNTVPFTNTIVVAGLDYYAFKVSSNALRVRTEAATSCK